MPEAGRGWGWAVAGFVGCFAACSGSGVVLETKKGDPSPREHDAGAVPTDEDAGPLKGVDPDSLRSGSRIHVRVEVSDGELLSVVGLHDTLRDVDCQIGLADDGVWRCLPVQPGAVANVISVIQSAASFTSAAFADPDCSEPVLRVDLTGMPPCAAATSPPAFEVLGDPAMDHCSPSTILSVMTPGAQIQPPPQLYDRDNPAGTCQPSAAGVGTAAYMVYTMNRSPASDWVEFESTLKPVTSRLGITQWSGADGSRMPGDTVLLSTDKPCDAGGQYAHSQPDLDTVFSCIPRTTQYLDGPYFSDAACTEGVVVTDCEPPELLAERTPGPDSCSSGSVSYFARGDAVTSTIYDRYSPPGSGPCTPDGSTSAGQVAYAKGAPIDPATYPSMQMVVAGSGRIRHSEWQSEGSSISDAGNLVDASTGAPVTPTAFADGVVRGAFSTTGTDKFFSDPGCKTWILDVQASPAICGGPLPLPRWVSFDAIPTLAMPACEGIWTQSSVRPVLGAHKGKIYTLNPALNVEQNGACSEYVPSKSTVTYDFYDLGNPVPASSLFAEIKIIDL